MHSWHHVHGHCLQSKLGMGERRGGRCVHNCCIILPQSQCIYHCMVLTYRIQYILPLYGINIQDIMVGYTVSNILVQECVTPIVAHRPVENRTPSHMFSRHGLCLRAASTQTQQLMSVCSKHTDMALALLTDFKFYGVTRSYSSCHS